MSAFVDPNEMALKCLLDDWYSASVLQKKEDPTLLQSFEDQATVYPKLRDLAQARLQELDALHEATNGNLDKRCFISHVHRQYLERVLRNVQKQN